MHTGEDIVHIRHLAHLELVSDAVEVEAGAAHENLAAALDELVATLDHLGLLAGHKLDAGVHEEDGAGDVVRLSKRVNGHLHEVAAQGGVALAHMVLADEHGVARAARTHAGEHRGHGSLGLTGLGTVGAELHEVAALDRLDLEAQVLLGGQAGEVLDGRVVVDLDLHVALALVEGLLRHNEGHGALLAKSIEQHGESFL